MTLAPGQAAKGGERTYDLLPAPTYVDEPRAAGTQLK
jgi:hypothetical protein